MLTTEEFYANFGAAGFLKACRWTPSGGGGPYSANVRFKAPAADFNGANVRAQDFTIQYPSSVLPGLKEKELVTIADVWVNGEHFDSADFTVRQPPEPILDGTLTRATLKRVIS